MTFVEDKNLLGDTQSAFRKGRRCEDHIFTLKGICSLRKSKKLKTYLGFIDVSKAFDTVDRDTLFNHIWDNGIQGKAWRLVHTLYKRVDNKVIFGDFQSETYEVFNGVKQGCILSPCLFNLVMQDLQKMLIKCKGVNVGEHRVTGLFYADDVVLTGSDEKDLQEMLNTAAQFADKWGLKFNSKKSQIMITGKRISGRMWQLGDSLLSETKTYKYLGVLMNRYVKDSDHVKQLLETKAKKQSSYIRYTLANHLDVNRVEFGNTLWNKAMLPSLSHAAAVWFDETVTSQTILSRAQYNCAKAVLKIKSMPAKSATLAELGWLPIREELAIKRISYFSHLNNMNDDRLTKSVLNELKVLYQSDIATPFQYLRNIQATYNEYGMDHLFNCHGDHPISVFKDAVRSHHLETFARKVSEQPSLRLYRNVKNVPECSNYLLSYKNNFKATQLKFKLRVGVGGLGEDIYRQHRGDGLCKICNSFESMKHFIFHCQAYNIERQVMLLNIKMNVSDCDFSMFIQDLDYATCLLLGEHDDAYNTAFLAFIQKAWQRRNDS